MPDLGAYEDDLIRQRLHLDAVYEALTQMRSRSIPTAERDRHLTLDSQGPDFVRVDGNWPG